MKTRLLTTALLLCFEFATFTRADTLEYGRWPDEFAFGPTATQSVAVGDVNGDGWDDVVRCGWTYSNSSSPQVIISFGRLHQSANAYPVATWCIPRLADVNNDGKLDIVTGPSNNPASIGVLLGNGDGTFGSQILTPIGYYASDMVVADVNKDGKMDVVLIGYPASPVDTRAVVCFGNGNGTFAAPVTYGTSIRSSAPMARGVAVGDVNGDGWPDLAVLNRAGLGEVAILFNNGNGTFAAPTLINSYHAPADYQIDVALADMNGDGKLDLITALGDEAEFASSFPGHHVGIWLNTGGGTFGSLAAYNVAPNTDYYGESGSRIAVADMDADGKLDVVVTATGRTAAIPTMVAVLLGNGDGTLRLGARVNTASGFLVPTPIRLDANAYRDIVVTPNSAGMALLQAYIQPSPVTVTASNIDKTVNDPPFNLASASGAMPAGGTFFGSGVNGNMFSPSDAGCGVHTISYWSPASATGHVSSGTFTVTVRELPSLVVNGNVDVVSAVDGVTSLREALSYAQSLGGARTILFNSSLGGQTITLNTGWNDANDASALRVTGQITLQGLTSSPGVTIAMAQGVQKRHLYVQPGGNLTVSHLTFTGGYANDFGGSIWSQGSLTVRNCTFTANTAGNEGGAIQSWGDSPLLAIENSTFSGNRSNNIAGAIDCGASSMSLRYVTITNNSAANGNTLVIWKNSVTMVNTIIAGNPSDGVGSVEGGAFSAQSTNNILGLGGSGSLTNGVNANQVGVLANQVCLDSLGNNNGATATVPLLPGSPAIDAGVALAGLTSDQRATTRPQANAPDIGAFELVWTQAAAIPIVSPLGGTYENSAAISIANVSAGSTVRYTLDGTAPSSSNGQIYSASFTLMQNATVKAIAYGRGWLPSPIASVGYAVLVPLPYWRNLQGLAPDGSQDLANPSRDGVANLLKFAFNLAPNAGDINKSNVAILQPGGSTGLPRITRDAQGELVIEFVRRKASSNPGIAYLVETGNDLASFNPLSLTNASIVSVDGIWEHVTVIDPVISAKRFARVRVQTSTN